MKSFKNFLLVSFLSVVTSCALAISSYQFIDYVSVFGHSAQLVVSYDECIPEYYFDDIDIGDGEDEKWYEYIYHQNEPSMDYVYHIPHSSGVSEIKYYISDVSVNNQPLWENITDSTRRQYVKSEFVNSFLKWNSVYFYKYNNNEVTKIKLVNIVEGSSSDYDVIIYPTISSNFYATTQPTSDPILIDSTFGIDHYHYVRWKILFAINYHYSYSEESEFILSRNGAHEFGHVFGLQDIDFSENGDSDNCYHHEELLMGYSAPGSNSLFHRQPDITYKDLVGVAITRGYHTDLDHSWLCDYSESIPGCYKLICSICNGVQYVSSLNNIEYLSFKACNDHHLLSEGNMFAVASYGDKDYYKCKYCRYVAQFTNNAQQNYSYTYYDANSHYVTNQVTGLGYSFYEPHNIGENGVCSGCGHEFFHSYNDHYSYYSNLYHKAYCGCGMYELRAHAIRSGSTFNMHGHTYGCCIGCGALIDMGSGTVIVIPDTNNSLMVTDNGSYILLNGLYIIVDDDLSDYLNGNLVFHSSSEITA